MATIAFIRTSNRAALDAQLHKVGEAWVAQRHAAGYGHPTVRRLAARRANAALAMRVAQALHVYLEDLDAERGR
jgi:hypothetical protein